VRLWLQAKVHKRGLGCGLGCTLALSVTRSSAVVAYAASVAM